MSCRRENRRSRAAHVDRYDNIEAGGLRSSLSYSSDIVEHENDKDLDSLKDKSLLSDADMFQISRFLVTLCELNLDASRAFLRQLSDDVHDEVLSHNSLLDRMGNDMDASRGILSGTVDRFKMVFEKKSGRGMCKLVGFLVVFFLLFFYLIRILRYFM